MNCVYIAQVACPGGLIKIGRSNDVDRRILQHLGADVDGVFVGHWGISLLATLPLATEASVAAERYALEQLKDPQSDWRKQRVRRVDGKLINVGHASGEWFRGYLDVETAMHLLAFVQKKLNAAIPR